MYPKAVGSDETVYRARRRARGSGAKPRQWALSVGSGCVRGNEIVTRVTQAMILTGSQPPVSSGAAWSYSATTYQGRPRRVCRPKRGQREGSVRPYGTSMNSPRTSRLVEGAVLFLSVAAFAGCAMHPESSGTVPVSTATGYGDFSQEDLASICIDATSSAFEEGVAFDADRVRVEERAVDPQWLVLVPAHATGFAGEAQCTIGGTPASPEVEISNASIQPLPEAQIQNLIDGKNEGGDR